MKVFNSIMNVMALPLFLLLAISSTFLLGSGIGGGGGGGLVNWQESSNGDLTADPGNDLTLSIDDDGIADANKADTLTIQAGNKTAGTGDGGDLKLSAGTSVGGDSGRIKFYFDANEAFNFEYGFLDFGPENGVWFQFYTNPTHIYLRTGAGVTLSDWHSSRLLYGDINVGWNTDGVYDLGWNNSVVHRPANIWVKTSIKLGNQTGETGTLYIGSGGAVIDGDSSSNITVKPDGTNTAITADTNENVTCGGGSLATNATDGFLYIPTMSGTPTGTPTTKTGYAPVVIDTTNSKMYFYDGSAWIALN